MKNPKTQLITGIGVLILTFLLTLQFKSITIFNEEKELKNMRVDELVIELQRERSVNEDLNKQIDAYRNDIAQYRADAEQNDGYSKFLSEQLKRAEIMAGLVDVKGPGITVTLKDNDNSSLSSGETLIHDEDLRRVVNELLAAGAEAVCINNSRIVSTTAIRCVGPTILVNDTKMAPPYTIKAIGKTDPLLAAVNLKGGVIDNLRLWGFPISVSASSEMVIPRYNGAINFSSATIIEQTEEGENQ